MQHRTSQPQTLHDWHLLATETFGAESRAVTYLAAKIAEQGKDMRVLASPRQMLRALGAMHAQQEPPR